MSKVFKYCIFMTIVLGCCTGLFAQKFGLEFNMPQGIMYQNKWGFFHDGVELSVNYRIPTEHVDCVVGINMRTIDWGSQISVSTGLSYNVADKTDLQFELHNGLALFHGKPLYAYSIGSACRFQVYHKVRFHMGLSVGARFTHCPAYKHYGSINRVFEIPIGLFMKF